MIRPLLVLLLLLPATLRAADAPKALTTWITQLQTLAGKHRKGDTTAASDAAARAFSDAVVKEHDGKQIQFSVAIKDVKWKDEIATITTEAEYGKLPAPTATAPLRLYRVTPFEVRMTEVEALAIKAGTKLRFTGRLTFHPGQYGAVGATTKSQQLYEIRHEYLGALTGGTFTSNECTYHIGGKQYRSKWVKAKPESPPQTPATESK